VSFERYNTIKPVKFCFKVSVLSDTTNGYTYNVKPYTKTTKTENAELKNNHASYDRTEPSPSNESFPFRLPPPPHTHTYNYYVSPLLADKQFALDMPSSQVWLTN
jgi:hypothetical protein